MKALIRVACTVQVLDNGDGVPDLLVGRAGVNYLLEVKSEKGRLTEDQEEWHMNWRGHKSVVRSIDDALIAVGLKVTLVKVLR